MSKILSIFLFLYGGLLWSQPNASPKIDESKKDTAYIADLFAQAEQAQGDQQLQLLSEALNISEVMDFVPGQEKGYRGLIGFYHRRKQIAEEAFSRFKLGTILEEEGRDEDYAKNSERTGDLFFENELHGKASEAYRQAVNYRSTRSLAPDLGLMGRLAWSQQLTGELDAALVSYRRAVTQARKERSGEDLLWLYQRLASLYHQKKMYDMGYLLSKRIYAVTDSLGKRKEQIYALNNVGFAAKHAGRSDDARYHFDSVLTTPAARNNPGLRAYTHQNLGIYHQNQQDYLLSIDHLQKAIKAFEQAGMKRQQVEALDILSLVYHLAGDAYNALFHLDRTIQLAKGEFPEIEASAYRTQSLVYQSLFEYKEALKAFENHMRISDTLSLERATRKANLEALRDKISKDEKELTHLNFAQKQRELELAEEKALRQAALEREEKLKKENELKDEQIKNQDLELLSQARQRALVQSQFLRSLDQKRADSLQQAEALAQANLRISRQEADSIQQVKEKLDAIAKLNETELANERLRTQNLFYLLIGLAAIILLILFILFQLRRKNAKINKQNVIIAAERKKSDDLLLNILPPAVATELKDKGAATPQSYKGVSVVFTDFKGFTKIAEQLNPGQLIHKLNEIFGKFDEISDALGLYRIKTIGDAYMAASGLPEPDPDHAQKAVQAALQMRDFLEEFNRSLPPDAPKWNIRIGVNSGPVVAGVVGTGKFAYDIWGDAVNIASRMESSGAPGKVNISGQTYAQVKDQFACEYRGKIPAKNKGEIDMYFVEVIKGG